MSQAQSELKQTEDTPDTNIEQQLHGYKFIRTLGKGNFGKVKLATHILTGEYVAIKILEKDLIFEKADIQRISRQIKIMKQVRHPYIIQLYEIIENSKRLYLIMEYGEGGDLFDLIVKTEKIQEKMAANIFTQIILGLEYLHKKGISHRDMKPQNILLSGLNVIKIADFGLGNFFQKQQMLKTACGSPCYASPQMLNRVPYNPELIDIWSSGIILYAMICGYLPFEDDNTTKLYEKIKGVNPRYPRSLSQNIKSLLRRLLDKNPESRIRIQEIKQIDWLKEQFMQSTNVQFEINEDKIKQICEAYGIEDQEKMINSLKKNKHNNITTIYYLASRNLSHLPQVKPPKQEKAPSINENQQHQQLQVVKQQKDIQKEEESTGHQQAENKSSNFSHQISFSTLNVENRYEEEKKEEEKKEEEKMENEQKSESMGVEKKVEEEQQLADTLESKQLEKLSEIKQVHAEQTPESPIQPQKDGNQQEIQQNSQSENQNIELVSPTASVEIQLPPSQHYHQPEQQKIESEIEDKIITKEQKPQSNSRENAKALTRNTQKHTRQNLKIKDTKPNKKEVSDVSVPKNKLRKVARMPMTPISKKQTLLIHRQKMINEKSHSKDHRDTQFSSKKIIGKHITIQPRLIDPDKIILCSWSRFNSFLVELGAEGKAQYYCYDKQCIYICRSTIRGVRNLKPIIDKINRGLLK